MSMFDADRDKKTGCLPVMNYEHHKVHAGDNYFYQDTVTLGAAGVQDYMITTPDSAVLIHFLYKIQHLKDVLIQLFEASDKTGTTAQTLFNSNRNSANVATLSVKKGTSGGTTDGTLLQPYLGGAAAGANVVSGISDHAQELMLKRNTKYILRITSVSAGCTCTAMMNWYEHTPIA